MMQHHPVGQGLLDVHVHSQIPRPYLKPANQVALNASFVFL